METARSASGTNPSGSASGLSSFGARGVSEFLLSFAVIDQPDPTPNDPNRRNHYETPFLEGLQQAKVADQIGWDEWQDVVFAPFPEDRDLDGNLESYLRVENVHMGAQNQAWVDACFPSTASAAVGASSIETISLILEPIENGGGA